MIEGDFGLLFMIVASTPPFGNFLVERIFAKMQEKDAELVQKGQLKPDKVFT